MTSKDSTLIAFFHEVGQLKRQPRSGWQLLGIERPESVADHTCRAVFIAYALAKAEGVDAERAALIAAFHELPETRIGDLHKVAQKYFSEKRAVERRVLHDQLAALPSEIAQGFHDLLDGYEGDETPEQVVARDADYLEVLLQAKEYLLQGHTGAQNWIDNTKGCLKTATAKRWAAQIEQGGAAWYEGLKRIRR